ncbi:hypothetical protein GQ53DRAFT_863476 [Thozetella sp. PMI_491]|nr:hypothetical protein GQ53DRAFT_863476 [Thozetella sp. PMI_491]
MRHLALNALFLLSTCLSQTSALHIVPRLPRAANGTSSNSTISNGTFSNVTVAHAPFANSTRVANATIPEAKILQDGSPVLTAEAAKVTVCLGGEQCSLGCCSTGGYCGFGPEYCGPSSCNAKLSADGTCAHLSECDAGGYPGYGPDYAEKENCPLNVCCSKYGFCGTTADFCGSTTWSDPSCGGSSAMARTVGYYEGWNQDRPCDHMTPERIPIEAYTHLNFAFGYIDPATYEVVPMTQNQSDLYLRFTGLKQKKPSLKTWIAIGGWTFNDPGPTRKTFTKLAASLSAQTSFINSLLAFMKKYNFDGVDLDWEYPEADDRGGVPNDFTSYVSFLANLRASLGSYGISITLPASYWYLQHFDIVNLDKYVDFFNIMTYDIYGTWDKTIDETGPYVHAHTNLSMIEKGLQLLWHNNIDPARVNLGLGFYGRSFTLTDPSCKATGCEFSTGGNPGPCTGTSGILSYAEIASVLRSENPTITFDVENAVKIATWGNDQWIGYDDPESLKMKVDYASKHCMGGTMVWAVDLDTTYTLAGEHHCFI